MLCLFTYVFAADNRNVSLIDQVCQFDWSKDQKFKFLNKCCKAYMSKNGIHANESFFQKFENNFDDAVIEHSVMPNFRLLI